MLMLIAGSAMAIANPYTLGIYGLLLAMASTVAPIVFVHRAR